MTNTNNKTNKLTNKRLSIQISLSGLSFCILDVSKHSIVSYKQYNKDHNLTPLEHLDFLKFVVDTEHLNETSFNQVLLIYRNELSTLVPKSLFDENNIANYLKFNNKILPTDFISYDELNNEMVNVYVPLININNYVYDTFGAFTYKHFSTVLIENILNKKQTTEEKTMHVNVDEGLFEVLVTEGKKIIFFNSFFYNTKEDFIYYILFTSEQLKMDPEKFPLIFTGEIDETSDLYQIAYKYVRHVTIKNPAAEYTVDAKIENDNFNTILLNSFS